MRAFRGDPLSADEAQLLMVDRNEHRARALALTEDVKTLESSLAEVQRQLRRMRTRAEQAETLTREGLRNAQTALKDALKFLSPKGHAAMLCLAALLTVEDALEGGPAPQEPRVRELVALCRSLLALHDSGAYVDSAVENIRALLTSRFPEDR